MGLLNRFRRSAIAGRTSPQRDGTSTGVSVKRANRDRVVEELASPDPETVALIRQHLPGAPRTPDAPLRAALVARAYRCSLRAGRRLSDEEGSALADAIDELSAYALGKGRA